MLSKLFSLNLHLFFCIIPIIILNLELTSSFYNKPRKISKPLLTPRIVGGHRVYEGDRPYQLYLIRSNNHHFGTRKQAYFCGAVLTEIGGIQFAITAAHCPFINGTLIQEYFAVIAGDVRISDETGLEQFRWVKKFVIHEEFDLNNAKNDIALLFLDKPFKLSYYVKPVTLPLNYKSKPNYYPSKVTVSGWGRTSLNAPTSDDLLAVELTTLITKECLIYDPTNLWHLHDGKQFCAGDLGVGGKGFCEGDSGGPATGMDESGTEYLVGIVSFALGNVCGDRSSPDIFTKVSRYMDWILKKVDEQQNVLGGHPVSQGSKPFMLYLLQSVNHKWVFKCGATLAKIYGRQFVLTSAQCVQQVQLEHFGFFAGDIHISDVTGLEQWRWAKEIIIHETFDTESLQNNIAIVFLEEDYDLTDEVQAIRLPENYKTNPNWYPKKVEIAGWGTISGKRLTDFPIAADSLTLAPSECEKFDPKGTRGFSEQKQICAGKYQHLNCYEDVGGPVIGEDKESQYLVGVVSYSMGGCNNPNYPDIYTKVGRYMEDWIIPKVAKVGTKLSPVYKLKQGDKPYLLYLKETLSSGKTIFRCGATLCSAFGKMFALTSAQCVSERGWVNPFRKWGLFAGEVQLNWITGKEQFAKVDEIVIHESYDWRTMKNDLAILFLENDFKLGKEVNTIRLPSRPKDSKIDPNWFPDKVEISGWGSNRPGGQPLEDAEAAAVEVPTLKWLECAKYDKNGDLGFYESKVICGGKLSTEGCVGDLGGPLTGSDKDGEYLVGIFSFVMGESCADPNYPDIYTKVSRYMEWVYNKVTKK